MSEVLYVSGGDRTDTGIESGYTAERLGKLVALLPEDAQAKLREGPLDGDHALNHPDGDCRACAALDDLVYSGKRQVSHAAAVLMDFHQAWDLYDQGEITNAGEGLVSYLRTVLLYVLAGWDGERHP